MRGFGHSPLGRAPFGDPYYTAVVAESSVPDEVLVLAYTEAFAESLPPGPLWDTERDVRLGAFLGGEANELTRVHEHLEKIVVEANPATADETLLEWEQAFGLPNACSPLASTREGRQAALRAAFLATGGQSAAYYKNLIFQVFGIDVDILEGYKVPFTTSDGTGGDIPPFSGSVVGDALYEYADWFEWQVLIYDDGSITSEIYDMLVCLLNKIKPAHTTVTFDYAG